MGTSYSLRGLHQTSSACRHGRQRGPGVYSRREGGVGNVGPGCTHGEKEEEMQLVCVRYATAAAWAWAASPTSPVDGCAMSFGGASFERSAGSTQIPASALLYPIVPAVVLATRLPRREGRNNGMKPTWPIIRNKSGSCLNIKNRDPAIFPSQTSFRHDRCNMLCGWQMASCPTCSCCVTIACRDF